VLDSKVEFCVRKEHVHLVTAPPIAEGRAGDRKKRQSFLAEIRTSAFQGLNDEYVVAINGVEFRALHQSIGTEARSVKVFLDRQDCIVLPIGAT
jgi:hypothetical protein